MNMELQMMADAREELRLHLAENGPLMPNMTRALQAYQLIGGKFSEIHADFQAQQAAAEARR